MKEYTKMNKSIFLRNILFTVLPLFFLAFCVETYAQKNTPVREGVVLYEFDNFRGKDVIIAENWSVPKINPWYNRISSISVPPGWTAVAYKLENFQGERLEIQGNWSAEEDNPQWDDQISSIKIYKSRGPSMPNMNTVILNEVNGIYGGEAFLKNPSSLPAEVWVDVVVKSWSGEKILRTEQINLPPVSEQRLGNIYINTGTEFRPYYRKVDYRIKKVE